MSDHNAVVARIAARFKRQGFNVQTRDNNLPPGKPSSETLYRPDIIVKNRREHTVCLVEVETAEGGKAVAGAAMLADVCMEQMNISNKPRLLFVFYRPRSNLKLTEKRLHAIENRITHLDIPPPMSEAAAFKEISHLSPLSI